MEDRQQQYKGAWNNCRYSVWSLLNISEDAKERWCFWHTAHVSALFVKRKIDKDCWVFPQNLCVCQELQRKYKTL